jgi:hypothetical protein
MAHVEAQCLPFGQVGYYEKMKNDLEINCKPHNNGTSGGTMPTFLAKVGVKMKKQENKSNLLQYQIFDVNLKEGTPKRLSRVAYNDLEE